MSDKKLRRLVLRDEYQMNGVDYEVYAFGEATVTVALPDYEVVRVKVDGQAVPPSSQPDLLELVAIRRFVRP